MSRSSCEIINKSENKAKGTSHVEYIECDFCDKLNKKYNLEYHKNLK
jgi:hypothetical protein